MTRGSQVARSQARHRRVTSTGRIVDSDYSDKFGSSADVRMQQKTRPLSIRDSVIAVAVCFYFKLESVLTYVSTSDDIPLTRNGRDHSIETLIHFLA